MAGGGPVSYTHLDVYKRQGLDMELVRQAIQMDGRSRSELTLSLIHISEMRQ